MTFMRQLDLGDHGIVDWPDLTSRERRIYRAGLIEAAEIAKRHRLKRGVATPFDPFTHIDIGAIDEILAAAEAIKP